MKQPGEPLMTNSTVCQRSEALKKETDLASQERRKKGEQEMANLQEQLSTMKLALEREREPVETMQRVKKELAEAQVDVFHPVSRRSGKNGIKRLVAIRLSVFQASTKTSSTSGS